VEPSGDGQYKHSPTEGLIGWPHVAQVRTVSPACSPRAFRAK
jgi:hypothetical protein